MLPQAPVEIYTLGNGLRVVLSEDHSVPVVSVAVYYDVGSRNEREGRTGFAHLFEHMMFQGSENVPKAGHFQYIFKNGGTMNGTTSSERTNYFETLPASQLPLALWLESDRMRSLKVTQENLDNQRDAVKEEKRLNYDNRPYSNAFLRLNELLYKNPTTRRLTTCASSSESTTRRTTPCSPSAATSTRRRRARSSKNISPPSRRSPGRPPRTLRSRRKSRSAPSSTATRSRSFPRSCSAGRFRRGARRTSTRSLWGTTFCSTATARASTNGSSRTKSPSWGFRAAWASAAGLRRSTSSQSRSRATRPRRFARR